MKRNIILAAIAVGIFHLPFDVSASGTESGGSSGAAETRKDDERSEKREEMRRKMREKKQKKCDSSCAKGKSCCSDENGSGIESSDYNNKDNE